MPICILPSSNSPADGPDVSVVIPTFNRPAMLREALESVYAQACEETAEVLVVNDNPGEDLSSTIGCRFPEVTLIQPGEKLGMTRARNRAIARARGRYVAFLDDDDLWEADYLKTQLSALREGPMTFAVSGLVVWDTRSGAKKASAQEPDLVRYRSAAHQLMIKNFIRTPSSVVVLRAALGAGDWFDEASPMGSDYDLYLRLMAAGFCPVFTARPLVVKRRHCGERMTDPGHQDERNAARLARMGYLYSLIEKRFPIAPFAAVAAEVHASFARRYFRQKRLLSGARSLARSLTAHLSRRPEGVSK
jgi:glycosyltransferase involved in cell wall biosynthesis